MDLAVPTSPARPDMNDPSNLDAKLILFKNDLSRNEIWFVDTERTMRKTLQTLSDRLELEYEYHLETRRVRITRVVEAANDNPTSSVNARSSSTPNIEHGTESLSLLSSIPANHPLYELPDLDWRNDNEDFWADVFMEGLEPTEINSLPVSANNNDDLWEDLLMQDSEPTLEDFALPDSTNSNQNFWGDMSMRDSEQVVENTAVAGFPSRSVARPSNIDSSDDPLTVNPNKIDINTHTNDGDILTRYTDPMIENAPPRSASSTSLAVGPSSLLEDNEPVWNWSSSPGSLSRSQSCTGCDVEAITSGAPLSNLSSSATFSETMSHEDFYSKLPRRSCNSVYANSISSISPPSSAISIQSRGRKRVKEAFNRSSSLSFGSSSVPAHPVLDSKTSRSVGRSGPLDGFKRAKMKVIKALRACWRCKFLKKPCTADNPCETCLKGSSASNWASIGCRRGNLRDEMLLTSLCPCMGNSYSDDDEQLCDAVNSCLRQSIQRRDDDIKDFNASAFPHTTDFALLVRGLEVGQPIHAQADIPLGCPQPPIIRPLIDCILAIIWEALASPWSEVVPDDMALGKIMVLLRSAASHQSKESSDLFATTGENNELISQSFICLRLCLQAMHGRTFGSANSSSHKSCVFACQVECIGGLEMACRIYVDELSRVLFKKENLNQKGWWLSTFYSLCIQGLVKKAFVILGSDLGFDLTRTSRYLHLGVRLFIAKSIEKSSTYDPLIRDWSSPATTFLKEEAPRIKDFKQAQIAVQQETWATNGIDGSGDYLTKLFEDDGAQLEERTRTSESGWASPTQHYLHDKSLFQQFDQEESTVRRRLSSSSFNHLSPCSSRPLSMSSG